MTEAKRRPSAGFRPRKSANERTTCNMSLITQSGFTKKMQLDIIIPNYNGHSLLAEFLPKLSAVLGEENLIVVDDDSQDDSVALIRAGFPHVRLLERAKNGGFSAAVNDGLRLAGTEFVGVLNNDVEVTPGLLDPILPMFRDLSVFSVSPRVILPSKGNMDEGAKTGSWHHGMFYADQRQGVSEVTPILYTTGCAAIYRRSMLEQLGGFDEIYSPFYWEDLDLGYRAWKRGWRSLYCPHSLVYHKHSASISKLNARRTAVVKARNSLMFIWRNIEDEQLIKTHRRWLPLVLARRAAAGDLAFLNGWREASRLSRECAGAREKDSRYRMLSDQDIFNTVGVIAG